MKRIEHRGVVDKSWWPRGPWDDEPDKVQWPDEATGLPCMVKRGPVGSFCGARWPHVLGRLRGGRTGETSRGDLPRPRAGGARRRVVVRLRLRAQGRQHPEHAVAWWSVP
jgi:hypothetical protein